jgi:small-conductance mechanosensitive channel
VVIALLLGLQSAGLDGLATKLSFVIIALGFAIREPISDFFSYFIILVQRPVKIGDLIQIEPNVFGVVRHITPRATIVRHRNSLTLIVPNSHIITHVVRNWHYTRTFGAIRDIEIVLPFSVDPDRARLIMLDIVDKSNNILKNPTPIVWLAEFSEYGFKFTVRGFLAADKVIEIFDIESEIRLALVRGLRKEGIALATPIRLLSFDKNNGSGFTKEEYKAKEPVQDFSVDGAEKKN